VATLSRTVPITLEYDARKPESGTHFAVRSVGRRPSLFELGAYAEVEVRVTGDPEPRSGYLVSITDIDRAVRDELPPLLAARRADVDAAPLVSIGRLLRELQSRIAARLERSRGVSSLSLRLTPFSSITVDATMPDALLLTHRFDFSAAHRLHLPELSEKENLARFGKCSHPSGHGHNYRLDVTVALPSGGFERAGPWESIVDREIIERYDHRHLNVDCPEFASLNPSVEHIAKVIHERLEAPLRAAGTPLARVCLWETEKTWCAFPS